MAPFVQQPCTVNEQATQMLVAPLCWPRIAATKVRLNHAQLLALVDGMDWKTSARDGNAPTISWLRRLWQFESCRLKDLGKNVADYAVMLAMAPTVAELPDDVDALKAMVLAIAAEAAGRETDGSQDSVAGRAWNYCVRRNHGPV